MTQTDEMRRILDERGVKWWEATPNKTKWNSPVLGGLVAVCEWNGKLVLDAGYINVTPEQAIAATVGRGTCHKVLDFDGTAWICSECGEHIGPRRWNYCPNCGRRIEVDG